MYLILMLQDFSQINFFFLLLRAKLHHNAAALHLPIGLEGQLKGVVDIIGQRAYYFEGNLG